MQKHADFTYASRPMAYPSSTAVLRVQRCGPTLYVTLFHLRNYFIEGGHDSVVDKATRYGFGGPGIESRWGRDFPCPSRPAPRYTQHPAMGTGSFLGVKQPGRGADHPHPSSAEVTNGFELYPPHPASVLA